MEEVFHPLSGLPVIIIVIAIISIISSIAIILVIIVTNELKSFRLLPADQHANPQASDGVDGRVQPFDLKPMTCGHL